MDHHEIVIEPIGRGDEMSSSRLIYGMVILLQVAKRLPPGSFQQGIRLLTADYLEEVVLRRGDLKLLAAKNHLLEWPVEEFCRWQNQ